MGTAQHTSNVRGANGALLRILQTAGTPIGHVVGKARHECERETVVHAAAGGRSGSLEPRSRCVASADYAGAECGVAIA